MEQDRPAGPSQPGEGGFDEGQEQKPDTPEEGVEPDFARGIDEQHPHTEAEGRFSRGIEDPATEAASEEGRFSEGIEQLPHEDK